MKTIIFNNEEYQANKIVKTSDSIIGKDINGKEVFSFKGIKDFSLFELEDGQEYDISEESELKQRVLDIEEALASMMGGE